MVEHRSPKPSVGRSSRSSRAKGLADRGAFFCPFPKLVGQQKDHRIDYDLAEFPYNRPLSFSSMKLPKNEMIRLILHLYTSIRTNRTYEAIKRLVQVAIYLRI